MNTFIFLQEHFARILLPELTDDAVADVKRAFTKSHLLTTGKSGRLSGWAIINERQTILQAKLAATHPKLLTSDPRTRYEA